MVKMAEKGGTFYHKTTKLGPWRDVDEVSP